MFSLQENASEPRAELNAIYDATFDRNCREVHVKSQRRYRGLAVAQAVAQKQTPSSLNLI